MTNYESQLKDKERNCNKNGSLLIFYSVLTLVLHLRNVYYREREKRKNICILGAQLSETLSEKLFTLLLRGQGNCIIEQSKSGVIFRAGKIIPGFSIYFSN